MIFTRVATHQARASMHEASHAGKSVATTGSHAAVGSAPEGRPKGSGQQEEQRQQQQQKRREQVSVQGYTRSTKDGTAVTIRPYLGGRYVSDQKDQASASSSSAHSKSPSGSSKSGSGRQGSSDSGGSTSSGYSDAATGGNEAKSRTGANAGRPQGVTQMTGATANDHPPQPSLANDFMSAAQSGDNSHLYANKREHAIAYGLYQVASELKAGHALASADPASREASFQSISNNLTSLIKDSNDRADQGMVEQRDFNKTSADNVKQAAVLFSNGKTLVTTNPGKAGEVFAQAGNLVERTLAANIFRQMAVRFDPATVGFDTPQDAVAWATHVLGSHGEIAHHVVGMKDASDSGDTRAVQSAAQAIISHPSSSPGIRAAAQVVMTNPSSDNVDTLVQSVVSRATSTGRTLGYKVKDVHREVRSNQNTYQDRSIALRQLRKGLVSEELGAFGGLTGLDRLDQGLKVMSQARDFTPHFVTASAFNHLIDSGAQQERENRQAAVEDSSLSRSDYAASRTRTAMHEAVVGAAVDATIHSAALTLPKTLDMEWSASHSFRGEYVGLFHPDSILSHLESAANQAKSGGTITSPYVSNSITQSEGAQLAQAIKSVKEHLIQFRGMEIAGLHSTLTRASSLFSNMSDLKDTHLANAMALDNFISSAANRDELKRKLQQGLDHFKGLLNDPTLKIQEDAQAKLAEVGSSTLTEIESVLSSLSGGKGSLIAERQRREVAATPKAAAQVSWNTHQTYMLDLMSGYADNLASSFSEGLIQATSESVNKLDDGEHDTRDLMDKMHQNFYDSPIKQVQRAFDIGTVSDAFNSKLTVPRPSFKSEGKGDYLLSKGGWDIARGLKDWAATERSKAGVTSSDTAVRLLGTQSLSTGQSRLAGFQGMFKTPTGGRYHRGDALDSTQLEFLKTLRSRSASEDIGVHNVSRYGGTPAGNPMVNAIDEVIGNHIPVVSGQISAEISRDTTNTINSALSSPTLVGDNGLHTVIQNTLDRSQNSTLDKVLSDQSYGTANARRDLRTSLTTLSSLASDIVNLESSSSVTDPAGHLRQLFLSGSNQSSWVGDRLAEFRTKAQNSAAGSADQQIYSDLANRFESIAHSFIAAHNDVTPLGLSPKGHTPSNPPNDFSSALTRVYAGAMNKIWTSDATSDPGSSPLMGLVSMARSPETLTHLTEAGMVRGEEENFFRANPQALALFAGKNPSDGNEEALLNILSESAVKQGFTTPPSIHTPSQEGSGAKLHDIMGTTARNLTLSTIDGSTWESQLRLMVPAASKSAERMSVVPQHSITSMPPTDTISESLIHLVGNKPDSSLATLRKTYATVDSNTGGTDFNAITTALNEIASSTGKLYSPAPEKALLSLNIPFLQTLAVASPEVHLAMFGDGAMKEGFMDHLIQFAQKLKHAPKSDMTAARESLRASADSLHQALTSLSTSSFTPGAKSPVALAMSRLGYDQPTGHAGAPTLADHLAQSRKDFSNVATALTLISGSNPSLSVAFVPMVKSTHGDATVSADSLATYSQELTQLRESTKSGDVKASSAALTTLLNKLATLRPDDRMDPTTYALQAVTDILGSTPSNLLANRGILSAQGSDALKAKIKGLKSKYQGAKKGSPEADSYNAEVRAAVSSTLAGALLQEVQVYSQSMVSEFNSAKSGLMIEHLANAIQSKSGLVDSPERAILLASRVVETHLADPQNRPILDLLSEYPQLQGPQYNRAKSTATLASMVHDRFLDSMPSDRSIWEQVNQSTSAEVVKQHILSDNPADSAYLVDTFSKSMHQISGVQLTAGAPTGDLASTRKRVESAIGKAKEMIASGSDVAEALVQSLYEEFAVAEASPALAKLKLNAIGSMVERTLTDLASSGAGAWVKGSLGSFGPPNMYGLVKAISAPAGESPFTPAAQAHLASRIVDLTTSPSINVANSTLQMLDGGGKGRIAALKKVVQQAVPPQLLTTATDKLNSVGLFAQAAALSNLVKSFSEQTGDVISHVGRLKDAVTAAEKNLRQFGNLHSNLGPNGSINPESSALGLNLQETINRLRTYQVNKDAQAPATLYKNGKIVHMDEASQLSMDGWVEDTLFTKSPNKRGYLTARGLNSTLPQLNVTSDGLSAPWSKKKVQEIRGSIDTSLTEFNRISNSLRLADHNLSLPEINSRAVQFADEVNTLDMTVRSGVANTTTYLVRKSDTGALALTTTLSAGDQVLSSVEHVGLGSTDVEKFTRRALSTLTGNIRQMGEEMGLDAVRMVMALNDHLLKNNNGMVSTQDMMDSIQHQPKTGVGSVVLSSLLSSLHPSMQFFDGEWGAKFDRATSEFSLLFGSNGLATRATIPFSTEMGDVPTKLLSNDPSPSKLSALMLGLGNPKNLGDVIAYGLGDMSQSSDLAHRLVQISNELGGGQSDLVGSLSHILNQLNDAGNPLVAEASNIILSVLTGSTSIYRYPGWDKNTVNQIVLSNQAGQKKRSAGDIPPRLADLSNTMLGMLPPSLRNNTDIIPAILHYLGHDITIKGSNEPDGSLGKLAAQGYADQIAKLSEQVNQAMSANLAMRSMDQTFVKSFPASATKDRWVRSSSDPSIQGRSIITRVMDEARNEMNLLRTPEAQPIVNSIDQAFNTVLDAGGSLSKAASDVVLKGLLDNSEAVAVFIQRISENLASQFKAIGAPEQTDQGARWNDAQVQMARSVVKEMSGLLTLLRNLGPTPVLEATKIDPNRTYAVLSTQSQQSQYGLGEVPFMVSIATSPLPGDTTGQTIETTHYVADLGQNRLNDVFSLAQQAGVQVKSLLDLKADLAAHKARGVKILTNNWNKDLALLGGAGLDTLKGPGKPNSDVISIHQTLSDQGVPSGLSTKMSSELTTGYPAESVDASYTDRLQEAGKRYRLAESTGDQEGMAAALADIKAGFAVAQDEGTRRLGFIHDFYQKLAETGVITHQDASGKIVQTVVSDVSARNVVNPASTELPADLSAPSINKENLGVSLEDFSRMLGDQIRRIGLSLTFGDSTVENLLDNRAQTAKQFDVSSAYNSMADILNILDPAYPGVAAFRDHGVRVAGKSEASIPVRMLDSATAKDRFARLMNHIYDLSGQGRPSYDMMYQKWVPESHVEALGNTLSALRIQADQAMNPSMDNESAKRAEELMISKGTFREIDAALRGELSPMQISRIMSVPLVSEVISGMAKELGQNPDPIFIQKNSDRIREAMSNMVLQGSDEVNAITELTQIYHDARGGQVDSLVTPTPKKSDGNIRSSRIVSTVKAADKWNPTSVLAYPNLGTLIRNAADSPEMQMYISQHGMLGNADSIIRALAINPSPQLVAAVADMIKAYGGIVRGKMTLDAMHRMNLNDPLNQARLDRASGVALHNMNNSEVRGIVQDYLAGNSTDEATRTKLLEAIAPNRLGALIAAEYVANSYLSPAGDVGFGGYSVNNIREMILEKSNVGPLQVAGIFIQHAVALLKKANGLSKAQLQQAMSYITVAHQLENAHRLIQGSTSETATRVRPDLVQIARSLSNSQKSGGESVDLNQAAQLEVPINYNSPAWNMISAIKDQIGLISPDSVVISGLGTLMARDMVRVPNDEVTPESAASTLDVVARALNKVGGPSTRESLQANMARVNSIMTLVHLTNEQFNDARQFGMFADEHPTLDASYPIQPVASSLTGNSTEQGQYKLYSMAMPDGSSHYIAIAPWKGIVGISPLTANSDGLESVQSSLKWNSSLFSSQGPNYWGQWVDLSRMNLPGSAQEIHPVVQSDTSSEPNWSIAEATNPMESEAIALRVHQDQWKSDPMTQVIDGVLTRGVHDQKSAELMLAIRHIVDARFDMTSEGLDTVLNDLVALNTQIDNFIRNQDPGTEGHFRQKAKDEGWSPEEIVSAFSQLGASSIKWKGSPVAMGTSAADMAELNARIAATPSVKELVNKLVDHTRYLLGASKPIVNSQKDLFQLDPRIQIAFSTGSVLNHILSRLSPSYTSAMYKMELTGEGDKVNKAALANESATAAKRVDNILASIRQAVEADSSKEMMSFEPITADAQRSMTRALEDRITNVMGQESISSSSTVRHDIAQLRELLSVVMPDMTMMARAALDHMEKAYSGDGDEHSFQMYRSLMTSLSFYADKYAGERQLTTPNIQSRSMEAVNPDTGEDYTMDPRTMGDSRSLEGDSLTDDLGQNIEMPVGFNSQVKQLHTSEVASGELVKQTSAKEPTSIEFIQRLSQSLTALQKNLDNPDLASDIMSRLPDDHRMSALLAASFSLGHESSLYPEGASGLVHQIGVQASSHVFNQLQDYADQKWNEGKDDVADNIADMSSKLFGTIHDTRPEAGQDFVNFMPKGLRTPTTMTPLDQVDPMSRITILAAEIHLLQKVATDVRSAPSVEEQQKMEAVRTQATKMIASRRSAAQTMLFDLAHGIDPNFLGAFDAEVGYQRRLYAYLRKQSDAETAALHQGSSAELYPRGLRRYAMENLRIQSEKTKNGQTLMKYMGSRSKSSPEMAKIMQEFAGEIPHWSSSSAFDQYGQLLQDIRDNNPQAVDEPGNQKMTSLETLTEGKWKRFLDPTLSFQDPQLKALLNLTRDIAGRSANPQEMDFTLSVVSSILGLLPKFYPFVYSSALNKMSQSVLDGPFSNTPLPGRLREAIATEDARDKVRAQFKSLVDEYLSPAREAALKSPVLQTLTHGGKHSFSADITLGSDANGGTRLIVKDPKWTISLNVNGRKTDISPNPSHMLSPYLNRGMSRKDLMEYNALINMATTGGKGFAKNEIARKQALYSAFMLAPLDVQNRLMTALHAVSFGDRGGTQKPFANLDQQLAGTTAAAVEEVNPNIAPAQDRVNQAIQDLASFDANGPEGVSLHPDSVKRELRLAEEKVRQARTALEEVSGQNIANLQIGQRVQDLVVQVRKSEAKTSKSGNDYVGYSLLDATGEVWAPNWDASKVGELTKGTYVKVSGKVNELHGKPSLTIETATIVHPGDKGLLQKSSASMKELLQLVNDNITPAHQKFVSALVNDRQYEHLLRTNPAAVYNHHASVGGLVEHTLGVVKQTLSRVTTENKSMAVLGAFFHDIGKIHEMTVKPTLTYTTKGSLLGHTRQGVLILSDLQKRSPIPQAEFDQLVHIVKSHHGSLEKQALEVPNTPEARLVHLADGIDAGEFKKNRETTPAIVLAQKSAEERLASAEAELANIQAGKLSITRPDLESRLAAAETELKRIESSSDKKSVGKAEAAVRSANQLIARFDQGEDIGMSREDATQLLATAQENLTNLTKGPTPAEVMNSLDTFVNKLQSMSLPMLNNLGKHRLEIRVSHPLESADASYKTISLGEAAQLIKAKGTSDVRRAVAQFAKVGVNVTRIKFYDGKTPSIQKDGVLLYPRQPKVTKPELEMDVPSLVVRGIMEEVQAFNDKRDLESLQAVEKAKQEAELIKKQIG